MDSIYEQPRAAPVRSSGNEIPAIPVVPEVSMIFQNKSSRNSSSVGSMYLPYNTWKTNNQTDVAPKPNFYMNSAEQMQKSNQPEFGNSHCFTKQVRFHSPVTLQHKPNSFIPPLSNVSKSHGINVDIPEKSQQFNNNVVQTHGIDTERTSQFKEPFERIYMANIPNRHLDLSIIEPPKMVRYKENLENVDPNINKHRVPQPSVKKTNVGLDMDSQTKYVKKSKINDIQYPEKLVQQDSVKNLDYNKINEPIIDLYNYKRDDINARNFYGNRRSLDNEVKLARYSETLRCDNMPKHNYVEDHQQPDPSESIQTSPARKDQVDNNDPTVKDLLKIIQQQNDQLLILQKQVSMLLNNQTVTKQIEAPAPAVFGEKCRTSTQLEAPSALYNRPMQKCLPKKSPLPQFSLDVMTSFEVSIRRQQNINRAYKEVMNQQPKICEVTETDSNLLEYCQNSGNVLDGINKVRTDDNTEVSLTLNEPVNVPQICQSPENTIQIHMEDYVSDSEDEHSSNDKWFYKNVEGQVNHILRKSGIWPTHDSASNVSEPSNMLTKSMRRKVKDATIRHLKNIGVHVPNVDDSDDAMETDSNRSLGHNSKEVSLAVKQLLLKYLPNEELNEPAYMRTQNNQATNGVQIDLIKRRPEFSFATVQYMQKYNLLTDNTNGHKINQPLSTALRLDNKFDRILDITAIKQQPKLL